MQYIENETYFQQLSKTWTNLTRSEKGFFVFMLFTLVPSLSVLFMGLFVRVGLGSIAPYCNYYFLGASLLFMLPLVSQKIKIMDILIYGSIVAFIYSSPIIWPASQTFVNKNASLFLWTVVPYYFVGLVIDYEKQKDMFLSFSRLSLFIEIMVQSFVLLGLTNTISMNNDDTSGHQMAAAYGFLFSCIYLVMYAIESRRFKDILLAFLSGVLLIFMGTRGPIVVYAFFIVGYLVVFRNYKTHNFRKKTLAIILFAVFYQLIEYLLMFLMPVAQVLGFSTRIFDSLQMGQMVNIDESNGRDIIWENNLDALNMQPNGYGWGGDRYVTVGDWDLFLGYAHNFWIEILVQFGFVIGGLIIGLLVILLVRSFTKVRQTSVSPFLFMWFCTGIMALQTSQTYITHSSLFILIGYCMAIIRKTRFELN